ncbi:hypothetical protein BDY24DRAFT_237905 [Mrakia frigida]|uniref:uncharacterized protein n=1 Tax=Mrakia frigida TaxID=29902 RepID=UPI003FCC1FD3
MSRVDHINFFLLSGWVSSDELKNLCPTVGLDILVVGSFLGFQFLVFCSTRRSYSLFFPSLFKLYFLLFLLACILVPPFFVRRA